MVPMLLNLPDEKVKRILIDVGMAEGYKRGPSEAGEYWLWGDC
jgi:hypothetical protein